MNDIALTTEATEIQKLNKAAAMTSASVEACGKLLITYVSGVIVEILLAESFRVLPGLYGNKGSRLRPRQGLESFEQ